MSAQVAFQMAKEYAQMWGTHNLPPDAPRLPSKIEYALRRIGGLARLNSFEAFQQAYNEAPVVDEDQDNA